MLDVVSGRIAPADVCTWVEGSTCCVVRADNTWLEALGPWKMPGLNSLELNTHTDSTAAGLACLHMCLLTLRSNLINA